MFKNLLIASAATLVAATAISGAASAAPAGRGEQKPAAEKKYCLQYDNVVGSRLTRTECKTKAQWAREGVDVDKIMKG